MDNNSYGQRSNAWQIKIRFKKNKTKVPYDELQWCRREHKNTAGEHAGIRAAGAAREHSPIPSHNPPVLSGIPG